MEFTIVSPWRKLNDQDSRKISSKSSLKAKNLESIKQIASEKAAQYQAINKWRLVFEGILRLVRRKKKTKKKNQIFDLVCELFSDIPTKCIVQTVISPIQNLPLSTSLPIDKKELVNSVWD